MIWLTYGDVKSAACDLNTAIGVSIVHWSQNYGATKAELLKVLKDNSYNPVAGDYCGLCILSKKKYHGATRCDLCPLGDEKYGGSVCCKEYANARDDWRDIQNCFKEYGTIHDDQLSEWRKSCHDMLERLFELRWDELEEDEPEPKPEPETVHKIGNVYKMQGKAWGIDVEYILAMCGHAEGKGFGSDVYVALIGLEHGNRYAGMFKTVVTDNVVPEEAFQECCGSSRFKLIRERGAKA
jgi:hypothetical protein